jgi:hypothetical protein
MKIWPIIFFVTFLPALPLAKTLDVPAEFATVQAGIDAAANGDTVLVAPGEYHENLTLENKTITLASNFVLAGDPQFIQQTVIDGDGATVLVIENAGMATTVTGFTIQNGDDGISPTSKFRLLNNRIIQCKDGIDYERGSGGICRDNIFELNKDDGIDLDRDVDIIIENNIIQNNEDDGIEIRLHEYDGPLITNIIRDNVISGNGEDGIQLIDYPDLSNRIIHIERNYITHSAMVGLGCMSDGNTIENYEGASIPERIFVINNTFVANNYGITGGDSMVVLNNLLVQTETLAMKNVDGGSIISYCNFWGNQVNIENCNEDSTHLYYEDPLLDSEYRLTAGSPCVDRGTAFFVWNEDTLLTISDETYLGSAPDIGASEYGSLVGIRNGTFAPKKLILMQNYPNPFNTRTTIPVILETTSNVQLEIYNSIGQKVKTLFKGILPPNTYSFSWGGTNESGVLMPSSLYFYKLIAGDFVEAKRMIMLK